VTTFVDWQASLFNEMTPLMEFSISAFGSLAATGVGALFLSGLDTTPYHLALFSLLAAGMMSGCSLVILQEALEQSTLVRVVAGFLLGLAIMRGLELLPLEELELEDLKGAKARRVWLLFLSLVVHSAGEGLCLGASGAADDRPQVGKLVLAALALHNIPEGLAVTMAFMSRGLRWRTSLLLALLSTSFQPLVSIATFAGIHDTAAVPIGLAVSSACMASIVCTDLVPDAFSTKAISVRSGTLILGASAGLVMCTDAIAHLYTPR
jgi:zinc transporter ZupT